MTIKSDRWIKKTAMERGMIEPFEPAQVRQGNISFGLSSYGYDIRLSDEFKLLRKNIPDPIDPKEINPDLFNSVREITPLVPPRSFILGRSLEYLRIPENILCLCTGKSTYARSGIIVNITPLEPGWEGFITISICNASHLPVRLYANEGIAQILFFESDEICGTSYADRKGRYQAQSEITLPKVDRPTV